MAARPIVYTLGYGGFDFQSVRDIVTTLDAVLVDIRMVPSSRKPGFRKKTLQNALGSRYVHISNFGNTNFNAREEGIRIKNYEGAVEDLVGVVTEQERPVVLMCGCKDLESCHRYVVAQELAGSGEFEFRGDAADIDVWKEAVELQSRGLNE